MLLLMVGIEKERKSLNNHDLFPGNFSKIYVLFNYLEKMFDNKKEGYSYWEVTGQAMYNFITLLKMSKQYILEGRHSGNAQLFDLKRDFETIVSKIKRMPTNNVYDVLCQTEICQNLHQLLNSFYSGSSKRNTVFYEMLFILDGLIPYDLLKIH